MVKSTENACANASATQQAVQAMLARALMRETADARVRVNELVLYSSFGWGSSDRRNVVTGEDIGRYVAYLKSERGAALRRQTITLGPREQLAGSP